jgi:hypothetical protein
MQFESSVLVDHVMSDIAAALETNDDVKGFGKQVDHPALAFISPVDTHDRCARHNLIHLSGCFSSRSVSSDNSLPKLR